jgi:hypothetical protein
MCLVEDREEDDRWSRNGGKTFTAYYFNIHFELCEWIKTFKTKWSLLGIPNSVGSLVFVIANYYTITVASLHRRGLYWQIQPTVDHVLCI